MRVGVAAEEAGGAAEAQRLHVFADQAAGLRALVHEQREARAARQRLQTHRARAGEKVDHARARDGIVVGVGQNVEDRLAQAVGRRADGVGLRTRRASGRGTARRRSSWHHGRRPRGGPGRPPPPLGPGPLPGPLPEPSARSSRTLAGTLPGPLPGLGPSAAAGRHPARLSGRPGRSLASGAAPARAARRRLRAARLSSPSAAHAAARPSPAAACDRTASRAVAVRSRPRGSRSVAAKPRPRVPRRRRRSSPAGAGRRGRPGPTACEPGARVPQSRRADEPFDHEPCGLRGFDRADALARTPRRGGALRFRVCAPPGHLVALAAPRVLVAPDRRTAFRGSRPRRVRRSSRAPPSGPLVARTERPFAAAARTLLVPVASAPRVVLAPFGPDVCFGRAEWRDRLAHRALEIDARRLGERRAELLLQDLGPDLFDEAGLEVAELERAEREADAAGSPAGPDVRGCA